MVVSKTPKQLSGVSARRRFAMSLFSQLRSAANQAAETEIPYAGGDPAELVAVADLIAARENCSAECIVIPGQPHRLKVRFRRPSGTADLGHSP